MPYVPSYERIALGLEAYGSDVPQDVLDAALAKAQPGNPVIEKVQVRRDRMELDHKALEESGPTRRKRARNPKGQLQADDPTTPDANEAWES